MTGIRLPKWTLVLSTVCLVMASVAEAEIIRTLKTKDGRLHSGETWEGVQYSPDGKWIVGIPYRGPLVVWDANTGRERIRIPAEDISGEGTNRVAFSYDSAYIAFVVTINRESDVVRVYDVKTGVMHREHKLADDEGRNLQIQYSTNDQEIALARQRSYGNDSGTVVIIDADTGERPAIIDAHLIIRHIEFSPDGKYLATCGSEEKYGEGRGKIKLWDWETRELISESNSPNAVVTDVKWFPNSTEFIAVSDAVRFYTFDAESKKIKRGSKSLPNDRIYDSIRISADSEYVALIAEASETSPSLSLWSVNSGKRVAYYEGRIAEDLAMSPDGKKFSTIMGVNDSSRICEWNMEAVLRSIASPVSTINISGNVRNLFFFHDAEHLVAVIEPSRESKWRRAIGEDQEAGVFVWNVKTEQLDGVLPLKRSGYYPREALGFSFKSGKTVLAWDFTNQNRIPVYWDPATKKQTRAIDPKSLSTGQNLVVSQGIPSQTGDHVVWHCSDKMDKWFYLVTDRNGSKVHLGPMEYHWNPVVSNDGLRVILKKGSDLELIDLENGADSQQLPVDVTWNSAMFSPDSLFLVGEGGGFWRYNIVDQEIDYPFGHLSDDTWVVTSVAFSNNGKIMATGEGNGNVQLWNFADGQLLLTLGDNGISDDSPQKRIDLLSFSPDDKFLVAAEENSDAGCVVKLWALESLLPEAENGALQLPVSASQDGQSPSTTIFP